MTIESRIAALEAELTQLKTDLAKSETADTWPKVGDKYYFIEQVGCDCVSQHKFFGDIFDENRKSTGNMFRTREEALQEFEHRKTITLFRSQHGRKVFVFAERNWSVWADNKLNVTWYKASCGGLFQTYFDSKESVENAIKAVGEDKLVAAAKWYAERV